jgi:hypothetical protein
MRRSQGKGIGGHTLANNGAFDTWLTPPGIIRALAPFDLDPCAAPSPRPWVTALKHIEHPADGLREQWSGRVWCNPPYGDKTGLWVKRMSEHQHGTLLIFARTETDYWHEGIWPFASAILFIRNRLNFYLPDGTRAKGNAGGPSALIAYGSRDAEILAKSGIRGVIVTPHNQYSAGSQG